MLLGRWFATAVFSLLFLLTSSGQSTRYVWTNSPYPGAPYNAWSNAAHDIQSAITASTAGDQIMVTNGVYSVGGSSVSGDVTNRVVVNKRVKIISVNGPSNTFIVGQSASGGGFGPDAVRCVYLTSNASLIGFTITNGYTSSSGDGGGVYCASGGSLSNCVLTGNHAAGSGGGIANLSGGGLASPCSVFNSAIIGNSATSGGGAYKVTASNGFMNCTFVNNTASGNGGGFDWSTAWNSTFVSNSAAKGGAVENSLLYNCLLYGNTASADGGAASGVRGATTMWNCTIVRNSSPVSGSVTAWNVATNCIVYANTAQNSGAGLATCFTNDPLFVDSAASNFRLSSGSPCIDQGYYQSWWMDAAVELDGNPRINNGVVDYGAYEYYGSRPYTVQVVSAYGSPIPGVGTHSYTNGAIVNAWVDPVVVIGSTQYTCTGWSLGSHDPASGATNAFSLTITNATTLTWNWASGPVTPATRYVWTNSPYPGAPYNAWSNAAHDIQSAINASAADDQIVVTNGVYDTGGVSVGGAVTNRVVVNRRVRITSVNGPSYTFIVGQPAAGGGFGPDAIRCVYLTSNASLAGFTITNGYTTSSGDGGGVYVASGGTLTNCVLTGNHAAGSGGGIANLSGGGLSSPCSVFNSAIIGNSAASGGGAYKVTASNGFMNCTFINNTASGNGGGFDWSTAWNSTFVSNSAAKGGAVENSLLYNCLLYGNTASADGGAASGVRGATTMWNCTIVRNSSPVSGSVTAWNVATNCIVYANTAQNSGAGLATCFTNDPLFVDSAASNFRLSSGSPCRDIGFYHGWMSIAADLDGNPRINNGVPDYGAYEYQGGVTTNYTLQVVSPHGEPTPFVGEHLYVRNTVITNQVEATVVEGSTQYVCAGWSLTNHDPGTGATNNFSMTITNDAVLTWNWTTNAILPITATVFYVAPGGSHTPPFTNWAMAAHDIQSPIDIAPVGAEIIVSNGVYNAGGRAIHNVLTNRVTVDKAVTVRSVNGPSNTIIVGNVCPTNGWFGNGAVRCAYVTNGATLAGFTLTNGCTLSTNGPCRESTGAGAFCEAGGVISNCIFIGNTLSDCGGGLSSMGTTYDSLFLYNSANWGGGVGHPLMNTTATVYRCTFIGNTAWRCGGGAVGCAAFDCTFISNSAGTAVPANGGGVWYGDYYNCLIAHNEASAAAGGAGGDAGGACRLYNCTVVGNSAPSGGGVALNTISYNSIIHSNSPANWSGGAYNYTCTTPLPTGPSNFADNPLLADYPNGDFRLSLSSPCVNAGSNQSWMVGSGDLDGQSRVVATTVDVGAYEYQGIVTARTLEVVSVRGSPEPTAGSHIYLLGSEVTCRVDATVTAGLTQYVCAGWSLTNHDPGTGATNNFSMTITNDAVLTWNWITNVSASVTAMVFYVAPGGSHTPPFTNWAMAAHDIQSPIDIAPVGAEIIVSNGVYNAGGRAIYKTMTNRVTVDKALTVRSVNGPSNTFIVGSACPTNGGHGNGCVRGVYLTNGATLIGFTITNGWTMAIEGTGDEPDGDGGGVFCERLAAVSNCILIANHGATHGGGQKGGTAYNCDYLFNTAVFGGGVVPNSPSGTPCSNYNCRYIGNRASKNGGAVAGSTVVFNSLMMSNRAGNGVTGAGGGSWYGTLYNCLLIDNQSLDCGGAVAGDGGGSGKLYNCTVARNTAVRGGGVAQNTISYNTIICSNTPNNWDGGSFSYSCTAPLPSGTSNFTDHPGFKDYPGGDFRLASNSPCINAGTNQSWMVGSGDLDGQSRVVATTVDVGAYEYQGAYVTRTLQVISEHGVAEPGVGTHEYPQAAVLPVRVSASVEQGSTQYVCTGWALSGNDPQTGNTNSLVVTLTNNAVLTWNWQTNSWVPPVYTITATAGVNGTINPSGDVSVPHGSSTNFTIQSGADSHIAQVYVDAVLTGSFDPASNTFVYAFTNVTANHTIAAAFNHAPLIHVSAAPTSGVAPLRVLFDFQASTDPDGEVVRCEVDQNGDGQYETSIEGSGVAIVEYPQKGFFTADLRVLDGYGASSSTSVAIDVLGQAPSAVLDGNPTNGTAPLFVLFTAANSTAATNHQIVAYEWDLNGDGTIDAVSSTGTIGWTYREVGTFAAMVHVTDDQGLSDSNGLTIVVSEPALQPPVVNLYAEPIQGVVPLRVQFTASATDDVGVVEYRWDFDGDGSCDLVTSTNCVPNDYTLVGKFLASVRAIDTDGLSGSAAAEVYAFEASRLRVWISTPKDGATLWGSNVTLHANTAPGSLTAAVQLQYKAVTASTWNNVGSALIPPPYSFKTTWDVTQLPAQTNYDLRAIATDTEGLTVTSEVITVAVSSLASEGKVGAVVEGTVDGKHTKRETFSKDETVTVEVSDGTSVCIPAETVGTNATVAVILVGGNTNPVNGAAEGQASIDVNREVRFEGDVDLGKSLEFSIPYPDDDDDGIVDGTEIPEATLAGYWFDQASGSWKKALDSEVHTKENCVKVKTHHLTEFGLFGSRNLLHPANGGLLLSFTSEFSNDTRAAHLTDGNRVSFWRSVDTPSTNQQFTFGFGNDRGAILSEAMLCNYGESADGRNRYSRDFEVLISMDGAYFTSVASGSLPANETPQTFALGGVTCRVAKLLITSGADTQAWELAEFELHGLMTGDPDADGMLDSWEKYYFGNYSRNGIGDYDADGLSDKLEYDSGTKPNDADTDKDSMRDGDEYIAGTGANDADSYFIVDSVDVVPGTNADTRGFVVRWDGVSGRRYGIEAASNAYWQGAWSAEDATNISPAGGMTSHTNFFPIDDVPVRMYRLKARLE